MARRGGYTERLVAHLTVPLAKVEAASARSRLLTLDISGHPFTYTAGQAIYVGPHGASEHKPFSIACSPEQAATTAGLELLVALDGPDALAWARPGAIVDVEGPLGTFTMPDA